VGILKWYVGKDNIHDKRIRNQKEGTIEHG